MMHSALFSQVLDLAVQALNRLLEPAQTDHIGRVVGGGSFHDHAGEGMPVIYFSYMRVTLLGADLSAR